MLENWGVNFNFEILRWLIWEFWLLGGLVKYFEDQLKNFKNIEDHFVILRGLGDQNVILQKLGVLTGISRRFRFLRFQDAIFDWNRIFVLGRVSAFAYHIFWIPPQYHYHVFDFVQYCFSFISWSARLAGHDGTWLSHLAWISRLIKWHLQTHRMCLLNYIIFDVSGYWHVIWN